MKRMRIAAIVLAAAVALAPLPASWIDEWYSRGVYLSLQNALTPAANLVPIALLDVTGLMLAVALGTIFVRRWRRVGFARSVLPMAITIVTTAAFVYLWFVATWGLNYRRLPLESRLEFDRARSTPAAARLLGERAVDQINLLRPTRSAIDNGPGNLQQAFAAAQSALGQRPAVPGVPKRSLLGLYFRRAAIDGMTDPWFLEIIVNPELFPFERPFVVAHEWAHLAGYAHEAEANFVGWLTCINGDADAQYSGWLMVYENVWSQLPRADRVALSARLSEGVREDLRAMAARYETSTPIVRNAARDVYDSYLRANRVREGIASYTGVVRLLLGAGVAEGRTPVIVR